MCTVYRTTGYFSKTERRLQQNRCFQLLAWSDFGSKVSKIRPSIKHHSYKVAHSFWLCIRTKCLSVYALSFHGNRSQVRLTTARYRAFGARTTLRTVSHNLKGLKGCQLRHLRNDVRQSFTSLVPRPRAPPSEKRSGERSLISWAY